MSEDQAIHPSQAPKVVYVLTSQGKDFYSAMTRVSVASVRLSNPSVKIALACDSLTESNLFSTEDLLVNEVDEICGFATPEGSPSYRNRYIKTQLRKLISGPFLFLDSDTLIRRELTEVFGINSDIGGCRNHSKVDLWDQVMDLDVETLKAMRWEIGKTYINGGVLFFNDTPKAHDLATLWHKRWLESSNQRQYYRDQPALNTALLESDPSLTVLPDRYNAQFKVQLTAADDAVLWHYYSSQDDVPITAFEIVVQDLLAGHKLDMNKVSHLLKVPHPWRSDLWFDDWVGRSVLRKGKLDIPDRLWFEGRRWESTRFRLGSMLRSLNRLFERT